MLYFRILLHCVIYLGGYYKTKMAGQQGSTLTTQQEHTEQPHTKS
jgi:hypothetical protein